jgi:hypothetical protein
VVTKGQFAASWTPVGALQTGNGYEVAFGNGANQYVVWNTDSNGDYTSNATGVLAGNSLELGGVEAAFGDGTFTGGASAPASATPIVSGTTTTLAELEVGGVSQNGDAFELNPLGGTGGPLLELNGSAVAAGQLGGWTPIGAVQTATGYEVAWSLLAGGQSADQYTVWNTDSNGDYTSSAIGVVSGQNFTLEDLNPTFGENLNGAPAGLSAILKTTTAANGTLNLSGQTQNATIDLGNNSASASGMNVENGTTTIHGMQDAITLNSSAHEIVEYGLAPSSGVETVTNFVFGATTSAPIDELNIALRGTPISALQFRDTMVGGAPAVSIFSSLDPANGLLLLGLPSGDNAAFVQNRMTPAGGASGQSHGLIS